MNWDVAIFVTGLVLLITAGFLVALPLGLALVGLGLMWFATLG